MHLQRTKHRGKLLGQILIESGITSEEEIYSSLATQQGYPYIKISNYTIASEVLKLVPRKMAEKRNIMPLDKIGNILTVVMFNPLDRETSQKLAEITGLNVKTFVTTLAELKETIVQNYGSQ